MYYFYDRKIDYLEICVSFNPLVRAIDYKSFLVCKDAQNKTVKVKIPRVSKFEWIPEAVARYSGIPICVIEELKNFVG